jgi:hypothetical protein
MPTWLRLPTVHHALWTLFVWGVRLRNGGGELGPTVLSLLFLGLAVAVLARPRQRPVVVALAALTLAGWAVRLVDIVVLSQHGTGFKVVHAVLAAVSTALAVRALRADRRLPRPTAATAAVSPAATARRPTPG